jgi:hypothetical protein
MTNAKWNTIPSDVDTHNTDYIENAKRMKVLVDDLRILSAHIATGGDEQTRLKHTKKVSLLCVYTCE